MTTNEALSSLKHIDRKIVQLEHMTAVLGWDMDTVMPIPAGEERGEQCSLLSSLIHQWSTSDDIKKAVAVLSDSDSLTIEDNALLRYWKKELDRALKLPQSLVENLSITANKAHYAWIEAREKGDYSIFEPSLKDIFELTKEKASYIGDGKDLYDTLLDSYEEGLDSNTVDYLFNELEIVIHELMDRLENVPVDDSFLFEDYDRNSLHEFCLDVIKQIGFDNNRGIVGITPHPYTTTLGIDDHRISTRYSDAGLFDPIGSIIHETGHALYEMSASLNPKIRGTSLGQGVSMGIHESQSRFWENIMGRSKAFWSFQYPRLQERISTLKDVSLDSFVRAINKSKPSGIRVNADELTYNLHIILRYKIEKELFNGDISVHDIPSRWNELSRKLIRYEVRDDRDGVLQDVHWSQGDFGYFPTYAIGNIYSATFYSAMCKDLGGKDKVNSYLESGNYSPITKWQADNIWSLGCIYSPKALLMRVLGTKVDIEPFKEYLVTKFLELYLS